MIYLRAKKNNMPFQDYSREFKRNLTIAIPIMAGQIAHLMVALADNVMVGKLGPAALAAVSLGNTLVFLAMAIGIGFSFAITPLVAERHAQDEFESVRSIFHNGLLLCSLLGIALCLLLFIAEPLLYLLKQPQEVVVLAVPYMRITAFSLIPLMVFQAIKQFSDGLSQTIHSMHAAIIANAINVILNYLLIYGAFGFPRLEVAGAAYGTLVARVLMVPILIILLMKRKDLVSYFKGAFIISSVAMRKLLNIGFPTALQMFFEVSLFTAAILLSGVLGTKNQAANQIALNLSAITFMVGVGLSVTATVRVGNQIGLKNMPELKRIASSIFLMTFFVELVFAALFFLGRDILPWIYIDDAEVVAIAAQLLIIAAIFQISDGLQVVFLGALRGFQDVWLPSLICFVSYWLVGFPVSYYLGLYTSLEAQGIWIGLLIGLSVSAVLMYWRYVVLLSKNLKKSF
jgi:MATE family multidrug resistance protein